jgi:hypothetical protein
MTGTSSTRPSGMASVQSPAFRVVTSRFAAPGGVGSLSCGSATIPMVRNTARSAPSTMPTIAVHRPLPPTRPIRTSAPMPSPTAIRLPARMPSTNEAMASPFQDRFCDLSQVGGDGG